MQLHIDLLQTFVSSAKPSIREDFDSLVATIHGDDFVVSCGFDESAYGVGFFPGASKYHHRVK